MFGQQVLLYMKALRFCVGTPGVIDEGIPETRIGVKAFYHQAQDLPLRYWHKTTCWWDF